ncbi:hypothetical protein H8N03_13785 [Ramlibacter sp. USB13]|uniref:SH3 domain-containing protein n=1 Tax=Ramlibacter cellulosilyticus TaxID=2764187 RepID=A0A923SFJ7_9BURK|nr:hypothetical protein [Ramlibacter cellulosilyticus]MBC5784017.1 hypothetical protein [Ramlibacter cellulosilyticus]
MSMLATVLAAASLGTAIVATDQAVLRASPRDSAAAQVQLWQGEALEVRGERLGYLQVWDHQRERGGYVRADQVRRVALTPAEAPDLLAVLRFLREAPGAESLGIGLAAAWVQAAPAESVRGAAGAEALDALGVFAQRLAQRASAGGAASKQAQLALSAHLDVAARYGVKFASYESEGRMRICYDGDAFQRVLALPANGEQKARAALALTQAECMDPALQPLQRHKANLWRAEVLDRVEIANVPPHVRNRLLLRRASVWSTLAYEQARLGEPAHLAAQRALDELAMARKEDLAEEDLAAWNEAAMRVNASRWAALPGSAVAADGKRPWIVTQPGQPGETCVLLVDGQHGPSQPLARRCTYALVWPQSATLNREGNALALAVQPMEAWRELWLFRRQGKQWAIDVLPPATFTPQLGYAEFAGWVPGGQQVLVAREARGEGRYRRSYEVVGLDSLATQKQSPEAGALGPFQRWQDPAWKRMTVSVR